jgi:hypothetical protein
MAEPTPFQLARPRPKPVKPTPTYLYDRYNFIIAPVTSNAPTPIAGSGANSAGAPVPTDKPAIVIGPLTSAGTAALLFKPVEPIFG